MLAQRFLQLRKPLHQICLLGLQLLNLPELHLFTWMTQSCVTLKYPWLKGAAGCSRTHLQLRLQPSHLKADLGAGWHSLGSGL